MQCFLCIMYLIITCSAYPSINRESSKKYERRSLFHDVIESLRLKVQIPEEFSNDENKLEHSYEIYLDNDSLQQPRDVEFIPRRNDRVEMPTRNFRLPKHLDFNETKEAKEEIVLYVNTPNDSTSSTTKKPKNTKRPKPIATKDKNILKINDDEEQNQVKDKPYMNSLAGQSQIGNRESQMVVKPTVIVNFRGSVSHKESDIRLERQKNNNDTFEVPNNIFNINQEINLESTNSEQSSTGEAETLPSKVKQNVKIATERENTDEDLMMCETSSWNDNERKRRGVDMLQIVVNV
ncbi:uncharacterized protein LOC126969766 [Leptidea sinapis]|uniref:uncharacterized protein LOC126969766 n=1 Tax=Leptidea sinapis TaxID=189913 RepID=UPI0021C2685E|nr:uncharacterized protein LOC126969766 [Leptidea sinapis]